MTKVLLAEALGEADLFTDGDWVESKDQDPDGDVRLVQLADVGAGTFLDRSARFMTSGKAAELKCTYLQAGDLLIARMPEPLGRACVFPGDSKPSVTVVDVCVIRTDQTTVDRRWLMHWFNSDGASRTMERAATGTTRKRISRGNLGKLPISLPPIEEQRRIAAVLDAADALRAKRRQALAKLDTLTQAIFIDMFGDLGPRPSSFGEVVEEFRYGTSGKSAPEGRPALRIPNVVGGEVSYDHIKRVPATEAELDRLRLVDGDLLFVRSNGNPSFVGRCAAFSKSRASSAGFDEPVIYASYLIRARLDQSQLLPAFALAFLNGPIGRRALRTKCKTSAGQYNINTKGLGAVSIPVPPMGLQREFSRRACAVSERVGFGSGHLGQLDTLFASLQQRAFRGEL